MQPMKRSEVQAAHVGGALRISEIFARRRGEGVFARVHEVLAPFGARRFTVATLAHDANHPVRYHYHADLEADAAPGLDQHTLASALGADQARALPDVTPVSVLQSDRRAPGVGRLAHAIASPVRAGGRQLGFCVAQGEREFDSTGLALLSLASVFIGQQLDLANEEAAGLAKGRAVELLLHTARALSTELDLGQLFAKFHELVGRVMDASTFIVGLLAADGKALEVLYWSELGKKSFEKILHPLDTMAGQVVLTGMPMVVRGPEEWARFKTITYPETADDPSSALFVPMRLGAHVLGVLSVQSRRADAYGDSDRDLLVAISEQAALAVENLRNLRASTQRAADLNLLVEVANAVSSQLDLRGVFSKIHAQVRRVLDAPLFYVALASDEDESVRLEYLVEGERVFQATTYATSGTIVGAVIQSGQPVLVRNAEERDRLTNRQIGSGPTTVQSVAAVPMHVGARVIGAISVQSYEPEAYDQRNLELLSAIAEQSAVAVQNARLFEQARVLADNDALTGLPHHRTIQERLSSQLKLAQRRSAKLAVIMMDIDGFKAFNDSYGHPAGDRALKHVARALRQITREPDIVGRYGGDEFCAILPDADRQAAEGFAARLSSEMAHRPIVLGGRQTVPITLSVGCAVYPDDRDRSDELVAAADAELYAKKRGEQPAFGGVAVTRALLTGDLSEFSALISALTNHSRFLREHVYHMNALAAVYAEFAGIPEASEERATLLRAATLIDVGMLAIPGAILGKPGKLSHAEYDTIKTHSQLGFEMLCKMQGCEQLARLILHHHERFDGSGYPAGLAGEGIPQLSRVLAVLDAFSAMISDRPFRRALSRDDAVKELRAHTGAQFDPAVADTFLKAIM